jgi:hypothetical protein
VIHLRINSGRAGLFDCLAEIGYGAGKILENLSILIKDSSIILNGYDISPHVIEIASRIKSDRIKFLLCDLTEKEPARL